MKPEEEGAEAAEAGAGEAAAGAAGAGPKADETAGAKADETAGAKAGDKPAETKPQEPDWKDLYARLLADFDNFKKRTARDREDTYRYAEADIIGGILPAVDNLALALGAAGDSDDPFVKGVKLAYDSFLASLKERGAEPFDSVGKPLDTGTMEAIAQLPSDSVEEGKVSNEVKRGWMLKGKVLRAAQVVVSAGPANGGAAPAPAAESAEAKDAAAPGGEA